MPFSENLVFFRKRAGITQEVVAERLNIARQTISDWENGDSEPDLKSLQELSFVLGVSTDALIGGDTDRTIKNSSKSNVTLILFSVFMMMVYLSGFVLLTVNLHSKFYAGEQTVFALVLMVFSFLLFLIPIIYTMIMRRRNK